MNDGIGGAFNGVGDYIGAMALDPSNYIGLLTGGAAKVGAVGASLVVRKLSRLLYAWQVVKLYSQVQPKKQPN